MHNIHVIHCKNIALHRIRHVNADIVSQNNYSADLITHSVENPSRKVYATRIHLHIYNIAQSLYEMYS